MSLPRCSLPTAPRSLRGASSNNQTPHAHLGVRRRASNTHTLKQATEPNAPTSAPTKRADERARRRARASTSVPTSAPTSTPTSAPTNAPSSESSSEPTSPPTSTPRAVAIALSAPQDCGKTTVVDFLVELFAEHAGLCCAAVSFDGFPPLARARDPPSADVESR